MEEKTEYLLILSLSRSLTIFVKLIVEEGPNNPISKRVRKTVFLKKDLNITTFLMKIGICGTK